MNNDQNIENPQETNEQESANTENAEGRTDNKIAELEAKVADWSDKYLRLYSEFDNYRKRTAKERVELSKTAGEDIFKSILPVIDDLDRAVKFSQDAKDIKAVVDGLNLISQKFKNVLGQKGLEEIKAQGEDFNTDLHEAITNIPAPSEDLKGKVVDEVEKGYTLNGKVIRFAKVVVGN